MHRRWAKNMPWKLEIWFILYNNPNWMPSMAIMGANKVHFKVLILNLPFWLKQFYFSNSNIIVIMHRFQQNGGNVIQKLISRLSEFNAMDYDAVFNCTGLGAQKLCNDRKLVPIRGQIMKVYAPWVKTAFYADYDTCILIFLVFYFHAFIQSKQKMIEHFRRNLIFLFFWQIFCLALMALLHLVEHANTKVSIYKLINMIDYRFANDVNRWCQVCLRHRLWGRRLAFGHIEAQCVLKLKW